MAETEAAPGQERERADGRPCRTWRLVLSYDGSDFHGWQVQPRLRTVQGELQRVIRDVVGESVLPQGSGRTDTGVHAEGQVVSVTLAAPIAPDRFLRALNRRLPGSVRVLSADWAPGDFHARGNVAWKEYTYRIFRRRCSGSEEERICPPMLARAAWDCPWLLTLDRMIRAEADVIGTHDFASFASRDADLRARGDGCERSTVRTIYASAWTEEDTLLVYRVAGSGFLHHMVRNLVGTFVEIGAGKRCAESVPSIVAARNRAAAGIMAPPQGLMLTRVVYRGDTEADRYSRDPKMQQEEPV